MRLGAARAAEGIATIVLEPEHVTSLARRARALVCGQLWLANVVLCALLCGEYLDAAEPGTLRAWLFLESGRISCAATLSLAPGLLLLGAALLIRRRWLLGALSSAIWTLVLLFVFVDTRIYGIFRYHFNGLVWNVLTTPGADEAVHFSAREISLVLAAAAAVAGLEYALFRWLWSSAARRAARSAPTPPLLRPRWAWGVLLVPNMFLAAGVYAHADLVRDPHVMAYARVYPIYPRLKIKRFAEKYLGVEMKERPEVDLPSQGILLGYPKRAPSLPEDGPRPNIVVVVIDSLRADMLALDVMPRTSELASRGRAFRDHLSSGNATRFGLFGLIYGLHGSYWKPVYDEHRSPVLVDALLERGYDFRVLTSASMDFPEFRSTAWVRIEDRVEDRLPSERAGGRDDGVARRFETWLGERDPSKPFFAFLLLDAPHQTYAYPDDCRVFLPCADDIAYSQLAEGGAKEEVEGVFNRYRNAVHYADQTTGRVLDALSDRGLLADTLLAVTGDHGEEFFENGFWGHTSNFAAPQVHVPFVLAGPGVPPGVETRPTSHVDLPSTLLELLGADPALRAEWTLGASLLDPPARRVRVVSGWDDLGLHTPSAILDVPMATHGGTDIVAYDERWQPIFDDSDVLRREGAALGALAMECRRFLR